MDIKQFVEKRPYLYHLTDSRNLDKILSSKQLTSTKLLVDESTLANKKEFLTSKRWGHKEIEVNGSIIYIRDQDPILKKVLKRSLEEDCTYEEFLMLLNSRVFFWPTLGDLQKHFGRYQDEKPIILRVHTQELFDINDSPKFCKFNSGATRCHPYYDGNAATRGYKTFLYTEECPYNYGAVREVTFENFCSLPEKIYLSSNPEEEFKQIK